MKTLFSILILMMITSCGGHEYKYRVSGKVILPESPVIKSNNAVWYTDTLQFDGDTAYYYNSNGNRVNIYPPFDIDTLR
jgi:hypothetical protein